METEGFAKTVVRGVFSAPNFVAWIVFSVMFAVSGPFGTYGALGLGARVALWTGVFALGFVVIPFVRVCHQLRWPGLTFLQAATVSAIVGGFVVAWPVGRILRAAGVPAGETPAFAELWATAAFITMGVALVRDLLLDESRQVPGEARRPKLLSRLSADGDHELLALSVDDHYVEVATDRGRERLLMRLSDAIDEASPVVGLRVHRSHWVARGAVDGVERVRGRTYVILRDGSRVPVSRAYEAEVNGLKAG